MRYNAQLTVLKMSVFRGVYAYITSGDKCVQLKYIILNF